MSTKAHYNIGELARLAGVSIRTLRHYDDIALLTPSSRGDNSYRLYTEEDCQRLFDILFYRALGFALEADGTLRSLDAIPAGRWRIDLSVRHGADEARYREDLQ